MSENLTKREIEVLQLLPASNKVIARRLGVEVGTVKNTLHSVFKKMRVRRRQDAVAVFRRSYDQFGRPLGLSSTLPAPIITPVEEARARTWQEVEQLVAKVFLRALAAAAGLALFLLVARALLHLAIPVSHAL
jgi:DNA-binding CsgD family transcriptional regulator